MRNEKNLIKATLAMASPEMRHLDSAILFGLGSTIGRKSWVGPGSEVGGNAPAAKADPCAPSRNKRMKPKTHCRPGNGQCRLRDGPEGEVCNSSGDWQETRRALDPKKASELSWRNRWIRWRSTFRRGYGSVETQVHGKCQSSTLLHFRVISLSSSSL